MPHNHSTIVPITQPHDEDYRRAMSETQTYVSALMDEAATRGVTQMQLAFVAIEALTHLVGGLVADGYRYQRRLDELERRDKLGVV